MQPRLYFCISTFLSHAQEAVRGHKSCLLAWQKGESQPRSAADRQCLLGYKPPVPLSLPDLPGMKTPPWTVAFCPSGSERFVPVSQIHTDRHTLSRNVGYVSFTLKLCSTLSGSLLCTAQTGEKCRHCCWLPQPPQGISQHFRPVLN